MVFRANHYYNADAIQYLHIFILANRAQAIYRYYSCIYISTMYCKYHGNIVKMPGNHVWRNRVWRQLRHQRNGLRCHAPPTGKRSPLEAAPAARKVKTAGFIFFKIRIQLASDGGFHYSVLCATGLCGARSSRGISHKTEYSGVFFIFLLELT